MRAIHFQVGSIHRDGNRLYAGGRNCGDVVTLGDVIPGPNGDVRVEAILTYRRYLNVLDRGLTGELELSGAGIAAVQAGTDLVGATAIEPPTLAVLGEGELHVESV